jgi:hypothetical protein
VSPFAFDQLDRWLDFHSFRSGPPPSDIDDLCNWIHALHIPGPYEPLISAGFDRVTRHHTGANECWLGITGPAHIGKTRAVTNVLIQRALLEPDRWRTRSRRGGLWTPYVYVEAASNQEARGLLASIARACGLPDEGSEKDLHRMLCAILPELGVRLIAVDEAHMFRRRSDNASRVADGLRVVLHLPVPFAFIGVDLHTSALLYRSSRNNDTALQLERRHMPLPLRPMTSDDPRAAARLIGLFKRQVSQIPDLDLTGGFGDANVLSFAATACEGRPGSLLSALKRSVIEAIATNDGVLTAELLAAEVDRSRVPSLSEGA